MQMFPSVIMKDWKRKTEYTYGFNWNLKFVLIYCFLYLTSRQNVYIIWSIWAITIKNSWANTKVN